MKQDSMLEYKLKFQQGFQENNFNEEGSVSLT